jgi:hypothetical protein
MHVVAQTDFNPGTKTLIYTCTIGFSLLAAWDAADALPKRDFGHLYFVSIPLFLGCVAGFIYLIKHRLVLSETTLWQYGFRTKSIPLEDIESITEHLGSYLIKAAKTSIRITTDLQHKDTFKDQVIIQFQRLDAVRHHIPGQELGTEYIGKLLQQVRHMVDKGIQNKSLVEVDISILEQLVEPTYYLVYEHPIHDFLHRAYDTQLGQLKAFICQYNNAIPALKTGVWVLPHSLEWLILCTEGDLFFHASN